MRKLPNSVVSQVAEEPYLSSYRTSTEKDSPIYIYCTQGGFALSQIIKCTIQIITKTYIIPSLNYLGHSTSEKLAVLTNH